MGDTSSLTITFAKRDLPQFNEVLKDKMWNGKWWDEVWEEEGRQISCYVSEANYGWVNEIEQLAEKGLTFEAYQGSGDSYGPCVCACFQGDLLVCDSNQDGTPVVAYRKDDNVVGIENARKYWSLYEQVLSYINEPQNP